MTGDLPKGRMHLWHYFGSLQNRVRLQDPGDESVGLVAHYQVLTDREGRAPGLFRRVGGP